jgi:hypothetical protein
MPGYYPELIRVIYKSIGSSVHSSIAIIDVGIKTVTDIYGCDHFQSVIYSRCILNFATAIVCHKKILSRCIQPIIRVLTEAMTCVERKSDI